MAARTTSLVLVAGAAAILAPLSRAGHVQTDPVYTTLEQTTEARIQVFYGLVEGNGWVVEAGGQDEREPQGDGSTGNETLILTAITTWTGAAMGADPSSHAYFAEKCSEMETAFDLPANKSLGVATPGAVVRAGSAFTPLGPFRLKLATARVAHVCVYNLRVFTASC